MGQGRDVAVDCSSDTQTYIYDKHWLINSRYMYVAFTEVHLEI